MAKEKLTLGLLVKLDDGRLAQEWQQALDRLQADCAERSELKDSRKVALVAILAPTGKGSAAEIRFEVSESMPKRKTRTYSVGMKPGGGLVLNELSPDDAGQMTIDEVAGGAAALGLEARVRAKRGPRTAG